MLVGRCLNAHSTLPACRSKGCPQRCCAVISSTGHQQAQVAQAAARTSATSEQVCQTGIAAPVAGHLSGLLQLRDGPQTTLSLQAQLNDRLTRCTSWEELAALLDANLDILDFVNISTAWTRLATIFRSSGRHRSDGQPAPAAPPVREPAFRRFLALLIDVTSQQLRAFGVQALANVMWALSNADWHLEQHEPAVGKLMHEWCASVHERLPDLCAPDVSNISTAIGRLDHRWRPEFVVEFYRSVLQREELLAHLDLTTLNNLLYGMSRARRRRLTHIGPAARRLLGQCVDRLLERPDREATGLVPWRAAQLLYNCHKVKLRVRPNSYAVLMPLVAAVYTAEPNPMDRWSIGFLTAFVDAHRNVHPAVRPDLRPLYAYVERRLPEASTSQMAMLAHAFRELGCPPPAPFWGQLFSRYLVEQAAAAAAAAASPPPPLPPQRQLPSELADGRAVQQQQQPNGESLQVLSPPPAQTRAALHQQQQQQYQHPLLRRQQQLQAQVQHHQQQAALALQLQRADRVAWGELPHANGHPPEPHRTPQAHRAPHVVQPPPPPQQSQQQPPQPQPQQSRQLPHALQQPRRPPHPPSVEEEPESRQATQPSPQPPPPLAVGPPPDPTVASSLQQPQAEQQQQKQSPSEQLQPPQPWPQQPLLQQQQQAPHPHPHARPNPHLHAHPHSHPQTARAAQQQQQQQPDLASLVPRLAVAMARTAERDHSRGGGGAGDAGDDDDLDEPRTLHYVCWQAAKAGILPPRVFLRLYVERVPQWLVRCADDTQVAQAVETLKLLRWVPRRDLREMLCTTLERRAATSRLPMRSLLRWVRQQR
ncbi:hypothetical protein PLESTM_001456000 [Pleodorina starrii]|nr:hypothetical protein PLESTM_001456000 [Pleodorina starrii]